MTFVSKDEPLSSSMVHVGYLVLRELQSNPQKRTTLTSMMAILRRKRITHYRSIMFGLVFLHSVGAIEFRAPYIYLA